MVINVQQQGYDIVHLRKKLFRKYGEIYFINFQNCSQFKFLNEQPLTVHQKKAMIHRLNKMLSKAQIPYGLNTEGSHNCESFVKYIKKRHGRKIHRSCKFRKKIWLLWEICNIHDRSYHDFNKWNRIFAMLFYK